MSRGQRLLLLPLATILVVIATASVVGMVGGAPVLEAAGVSVAGFILSSAWRWRARLLAEATLVLGLMAAVVEGVVLRHEPGFGSGGLQAPASVSSSTAALLIAGSLLMAVTAGWLLFIRLQPWGTAIILATAFLVRADVDARFATWLPVLVAACLALVLLANVQSVSSIGRGTGVLAVASVAIAICWQLPTPIPAWSHGFIDPLASMVGNRYGPPISQALELTGEFQPSNRVVMSIHTFNPVARPYWRLAVFDRYDGQSWTPSSSASRTVPAGTPMLPGTYARSQHIVNAVVTVYQADSSLISPGVPLAVSVPSRVSYAAGAPQPSSVTAAVPLASDTSYRVSGVASPVDPATGDAVSRASLAPYTAIPNEPHRVGTLAARIVRGASGPIARVEALVHYLRDSGRFHYDTRAGSPPGQDAVYSFLFDTHRGYCNQFASALAILAREIDLPSRVVTGYVGGDYRHGRYLIRQRDAHSWVEIYIPGQGWLTFDPTPGFNDGPIETKTQAHSSGTAGRRAGFVRPTPPSRAAGARTPPPGHGYRVPITPPHVSVRPHHHGLVPLWLILLALALLAAAAGAILLARRQPANLYAALARGQSRPGIRIRAEETPLEFVERFQGYHEYDDARLIVDLYIRERYAGVEPSLAERRASQQAWARLRGRRLPTYSIIARR